MTDRFARSREQQERAKKSLASGVATAFRASQLPVPVSFSEGSGAWLTDIDGNRYVDWSLAFGPMLLGHSPDAVVQAVVRQLSRGIGFGASHLLEAELAEAVCRTVPSAETCIFASTGSEAVHEALRIARAATGRRRVIKFLGHYHGWLDPLNVGLPGQVDGSAGSAGQDPGASASVTVCPWNDLDSLAEAMDDDVAAVIMEPIAVNGGCLVPLPGYLQAVRDLVTNAGAILIFDEVITGYRLALGGAQERLGVLPDLTVLGKALGMGFPISAVCGRSDVMAEVASFRVRHVGTFNANPICAAAALAGIGELESDASELYERLERVGEALADLLRKEAAAVGVPLWVNQVGGACQLFVTEGPVTTYLDTVQVPGGDGSGQLVGLLLEEGVHALTRGSFYVSAVHGDRELEVTQAAFSRAVARMAGGSASNASISGGMPGNDSSR